MAWYLRINGKMGCMAPEADGTRVSCMCFSKEDADDDAATILEKHPDALVEIVERHDPYVMEKQV